MVRRNGSHRQVRFHESKAGTAADTRTGNLRLTYLLDTNACIAIIKDNSAVHEHLRQAFGRQASVFVSAIAAYELWFGVANSGRKALNGRVLEKFLTGPIQTLPFDHEDGRVAGEIRAQLKSIGTPIGAYDLLIAGQALRHRMTLVTSNVSEFSRVKGLKRVDWAKSH